MLDHYAKIIFRLGDRLEDALANAPEEDHERLLEAVANLNARVNQRVGMMQGERMSA